MVSHIGSVIVGIVAVDARSTECNNTLRHIERHDDCPPDFGLDVVPQGSPPSVTDWNKLAWDHLGDIDTIHIIDLDTMIPDTNIPAANLDRAINWGGNAADMAYILYQDPVMVAIHGSDMLD